MALEAEVRTNDGVSIIDLRGDIDRDADEALSAAYASSEAGPGAVLLNFAGVSYISSSGIALIVGVLSQARKANRTVRACGLTEHYREIFEITRLADFVEIFDDETSATTGSGSRG